jgi:hypothetical protein
LGNAFFGFIGPESVNLRLRRKVKAGEQLFHQIHPGISWKLQNFILYFLGDNGHISILHLYIFKHILSQEANLS